MNKKAEAERKAKLAQMRKSQQSTERRRTLLVAGAAGVLVIALVGVVTAVVLKSVADNDPARVGVAAAAAECDAVVTDAATGSSVHVGPGTDKPEMTKIRYATVPPSSGQHFPQPEYPARNFYTAEDRPEMEKLVHNLEHGYTVLWYAPDLPKAQIDELRKISTLVARKSEVGGKFIVSAWDDEYGKLPADKPVALSHWGAKNGFRQLCGKVSGEAIKTFVDKHPVTDSPEPNGA